MIEVTDAEIQSLTAAIMNRHGIDFTGYEPKSLKRRIIRALSVFKLQSIHELWVKILREKDFVPPFVNELSVGLTSMFRDPTFWKYLKSALPEIAKNKTSLQIWHAGCSTGEEVYTMGIVLNDAKLNIKASALATDMNTDALRHAELGKYHILKLKEYDLNYQKYGGRSSFATYYKEEEGYGYMDSKLIQHVKFQESNLITDTLKQKFDIIFCRNVMIYFDSGAKQMVLNKFYENLKPNGLLIIGYFDALVPVIDKDKFEMYSLPQKIFRKIN